MNRWTRVGLWAGKHITLWAVAIVLLAPLAGGRLQPWAFARGNVAKLESRIAESTNAERVKHGLPALRIESVLAQVAREHSEEMATLDYFSHDSPTKGSRTMTDRLKRADVPYTYAGENIAYYEGYSLRKVAPQAITDWMSSPGHRDNILSPNFTCIGVGAATKGDKTYVTQVFAALRR